ncbi:LysR substrate-binding domain-containing protein [Thiofilum flexile]|uniref:LysR substrate-binding domain-containing protein n=1 Tax=Thiofilum flexile TaxID=125627 RepID=UPI00036DD608|nr:LysR substrate-binding domain-containing protein [Thiofilum flexile]
MDRIQGISLMATAQHTTYLVLEDNLSYLRIFLAVAEAGSISKAAEHIFKTPSAITRAIAKLEQILEISLFERKPRGMLLTSYGEVVLRRVQRIEQEIHAAAQVLDNNAPTHQLLHPIINTLFSGKKLLLFATIAEQKQVVNAAHRLGMSQAGVSMALSRLESALGRPLFQRLATGMCLNDSGEKLLIYAKRVLAELRHMLSDISAIQGALEGTITIGALPLGRTVLLPLAIAEILKNHPRLQIKTLESPYEILVSGLRSGDIDFILGALRPDELSVGLVNETLFIDKVAIVARANHPLTQQHPIDLAQLAHAQWILPRTDTPSRTTIDVAFQSAGLPPPLPSVETGDLALLRTLLQVSDLITAISPHQVCFEIQEGKLKVLPIQLSNAPRAIGIVTREGSLLSPATFSFLAEIRTLVQTQGLTN